MGEYELNGSNEPHGHIDRKVQIVASHPKFDPKTFEYDLALLRFYEPVTFQPNVVPICVPDDDQKLVGETAWVTGWGRLYEGESVYFFSTSKTLPSYCSIVSFQTALSRRRCRRSTCR